MSSPPLSPSGSGSPARALARAVLGPVQRFLAIEASSGVVLIVAAAAALILANSPARAAFEGVWTTTISLPLGASPFARDVRWWVNDGLMTVFFFVVGLEIRREIHGGELSDLRRAALPIAAAVGGMILPALIYLGFNAGHPSASGWGVPMATDIAFAVGVLALLGPRVPPALRILLLALAVIDDLGAILVIAAFYSEGVKLTGLAVAAAGLAVAVGMRTVGVRSPLAYVPVGIVTWAGTYASGVHPTIAGVALGLLTPVTAPDGEESPAEGLIRLLHGPVAFGIMPLFALGNAGVPLGDVVWNADTMRVFAGVTVGLVVGKALGVLGLSRAVAALGLATPPRGVRWSGVSVVGVVAGIGFTMALFIAQLGLPPGPLLETAKLGILLASAVAGVAGLLWGRIALAPSTEGARDEDEAEHSTEL